MGDVGRTPTAPTVANGFHPGYPHQQQQQQQQQHQHYPSQQPLYPPSSSSVNGRMPSSEELAGLQGLTLDSSPVKPSSSTQTRSSSSDDPASSQNGSGSGINMPMFVQQEDIEDVDDDDDDEPRKGGKKGQANPGRRKIEIEYIEDKSKRHITFSKRKAGIMKKAYELSTLTGTQVLLLVVSETGLVYTYTTSKLQPLVTAKEGKALIQACLTAEEGEPPFGDKADMPPATPTRSRADHRKVSMQVRMDPDRSGNTYTPSHAQSSASSEPAPTLPTTSYLPAAPIPQQPGSHTMPQMMQPPYMTHPTMPQNVQTTLMPPASMMYPHAPNSVMPVSLANMPPMPVPAASTSTAEASTSNSRTLKKRKTVDNLKTGKEGVDAMELRRNDASQIAQTLLDQARQNPTIGNLLRAYQQQDIASRTKPSKSIDGALEGLDSTIQLFQMSCEDSARGMEAEHARLRGERWVDHVGVGHLSDAIDSFLHDFLVNKVIRTAKDVKASAKDLHNFTDWLFAHSFIMADMHARLIKQCNTTNKSIKKRGSEPQLAPSIVPMMSMSSMPNGLVRQPANPAARAESAGKTLIDFCEYARAHYDGLGQEQGVTALNGYFIVERVRSSFCILRGIPIEGDPHSNSEPGPFKVRMPRQLTAELRPRDQFLLSLNRYMHSNYWIPTACGDVHPTTEEEFGEDPLNPQYHHMEADKAQRTNDQMSYNYHATEYQYTSKVVQLLEEGELPEDGFGGVSVQQVLHSHSSIPNLAQQASLQQQQQQNQQSQQQLSNDNQRPVRRSRARGPADMTNAGWGDYQ